MSALGRAHAHLRFAARRSPARMPVAALVVLITVR